MHIYTNKNLYSDIIHRGIQRKYFSFPIIIPPVIHKSEIFHGRLGVVWEEAQKRLEQAAEIIAFGYSFPASDFESANLFKRAMKANQNELTLSIIDPDPSVVSRFANITGIERINWYKFSSQYLKKSGDAPTFP